MGGGALGFSPLKFGNDLYGLIAKVMTLTFKIKAQSLILLGVNNTPPNISCEWTL